MKTYHYRAIDQEGGFTKGCLVAEDKNHLEFLLRIQKKEMIRAHRAILNYFQKRISDYEMIEFCIQLQSLIQAKVPLIEALKSIHQELPASALKQALEEIIREVDSGKPFSKCLIKFPSLFDSVFVNLIQISEETGKLDESMTYLVDHLKWQEDFKSKSKKALVYPFFLFGMTVFLAVVLLSTLVPQMTQFFESMGGDLPLITRILVNVSDFMVAAWFFVGGGLIVLLLGIGILSRLSTAYKVRLHKLKLKLPFVGNLTKTIYLMRFFHMLSIMIASHVEILRALRSASDTVENLYIKELLKGIQKDVQRGQTLSTSIARIPALPNFVHRIIKVGENSGSLMKSLQDINYFYEREVGHQTSRLLKLLEPSMLVVMGALVAWIALAIFSPLYDSLGLIDF